MATTFTEEQIANLEAKYKRITRVKSREGVWELVIAKPARKDFKRYRSALQNDAQKADAQENLVRTCIAATCINGVVELDQARARAALDELLDDYPAIYDSDAMARALEPLISGAQEADAK